MIWKQFPKTKIWVERSHLPSGGGRAITNPLPLWVMSLQMTANDFSACYRPKCNATAPYCWNYSSIIFRSAAFLLKRQKCQMKPKTTVTATTFWHATPCMLKCPVVIQLLTEYMSPIGTIYTLLIQFILINYLWFFMCISFWHGHCICWLGQTVGLLQY